MTTAKRVAPATSEPPRQARGKATSEGILRAALRLMADNGYNGVSLRRICLEAEVNLALMNYYFGSKAQLLTAIFERWAAPINAERRRLLEEVDARHPDGKPPLEELLHAFIVPTLTASNTNLEDELSFVRLSGRLATDPTPEVRKAIANVYDEAGVKFARSLRQACMHLDTEEFRMRLMFLYGAMVYTRSETGRVDSLTEKLGLSPQRVSVHEAGKYLVPFLAAALRAPATAA
ncbi:MAG: TetR family transcriptional regulator, partial [Proteobacteria bacterium]|nr:TetR family transcriptional regulator [Pseudomonadota bacterium]